MEAASFEVAFPAGAMVETHSLSTETMNGIQAVAVSIFGLLGFCFVGLRVCEVCIQQ